MAPRRIGDDLPPAQAAFAHGRRARRRGLAAPRARGGAERSALPRRGRAGMPGAGRTRSLVRKWSFWHTSRRHHGCAGSPGIPARDGLRLASCSPRWLDRWIDTVGSGLTDRRVRLNAAFHRPLDSYARFQDHTTWAVRASAVVSASAASHGPSFPRRSALMPASAPDAARVHRILPRVRDERDTPLCGTGRQRSYARRGARG